MGSGPRRPNLRSALQVDLGSWSALRTYLKLAILCKSCTCFDSRKAPKTCQGLVKLSDSGSVAHHQSTRAGQATGPCLSSIELCEVA